MVVAVYSGRPGSREVGPAYDILLCFSCWLSSGKCLLPSDPAKETNCLIFKAGNLMQDILTLLRCQMRY